MRKIFKSPLILALAAVVLCVFSRDTQTVDQMFMNSWYKIRSTGQADGSVVVSLDNGSTSSAGTPANSTLQQAHLVDFLAQSGVKHIYLDFPMAAGADQIGDQQLSAAVARAGNRITLVSRATIAGSGPGRHSELTIPKWLPPVGTKVAASRWKINTFDSAISTTATVESGGVVVPNVVTMASGKKNVQTDELIVPDFRINPATIATVSASDVLTGSTNKGLFKGQNVFVSSTSTSLNSALRYFGSAIVPSAKIDISGAMALRGRQTTELGGYPLLILFTLMVIAGNRSRSGRIKLATYAGVVVAITILPGVLRDHGVVTDAATPLIAAIVYGPMRAWQKFRQRVQLTSSSSGLPNIEALADQGIPGGYDVIAAYVSHYEQMLASLPRELHGECARQIARRLSLAANEAVIYDNDNGHFVWQMQPYSEETLVAQMQALKALFSSALLIDGHVLDTNVYFGIDRNTANRPINRIKSAIASATEAHAKGKLFEEFGSERLAETPWELSLHARIDRALSNGDIWLAYQAQYDLGQDRISGAEALIRWTDPDRGIIPPDSFIIQAERAGRIDAITYWVLDKAVDAAIDLQARGSILQLSVNLSAWMVDQPGLISNISEVVRRRNFDCSQITFEVTETFSMANREIAKRNLLDLRAMGFRLSIDDFGTGQASLAYLSEIPSDEIKMDRRFVQAIVGSIRDRAIVANTVQLAHALGQTIVAEGVEDRATLDVLRTLGCDLAQGYFIGKPIAYDEFVASLDLGQQRRIRYG